VTVRKAWTGVVNSTVDLAEAAVKPEYAVAKVAARLRPGQSASREGKFFNLVRAPWDGPCPTIAKTHGQSASMAGLMHPTDMRRPTIPELARIGSFPDEFRFVGSFGEQWARIGNSVPPLFLRAIARHIRGTDERTPKMTYVELLDAAWRDHLAPREPGAPTVISLFAGCGGSSLGYSMAGFRELLAVEWDDNAVATFCLNFPEVPVYHGDIAALSVEDACGLAGMTVGALDVLDGSPPCQGFSMAGKRDMDDDRNQLFREFTRLLAGLQPRAFVMENVSGMVKGKMRLIFVDILRELKACGYRVSARLLNAMYFGVPQSRQRLIFVGVREDLDGEPSHPRAAGRAVTVRQALLNVPEDPTAFHVKPETNIYQDMLKVAPGQSQPRHHSHLRLPMDKPSPAVLADAGFGHYHYWHPLEQRTLTFLELMRIASFGDHFRLTGGPGQRWQRIGNSVPPLFMRAIAQHVRETILTPELALAP